MRHLSRHVHATLVDLTKVALADWIGMTPPYGATRLTVTGVAPSLPEQVEPNLVTLSLEYPSSPRPAELGGGLQHVGYTIFWDVFAENVSTCMAIVDDLRVAFAEISMPVYDHTDVVAVATDNWIEIDELEVDEPPAAGQVDRSHWRVVSGPVDVYVVGGLL